MKIAILGGSFDPPHLGHLILARQVLDFTPIEQVWFMPVFEHPFHKALSPAQDRLVMTRMVEEEKIKASDYEIEKGGTSYTIDTLSSLAKKYPEHSFALILGEDQLESFHKWKDWKKIIEDYALIIIPRNIDTKDLHEKTKKAFELNILPPTIHTLRAEELIVTNISSSQIRKRVKNGLSIKYLVPESVEKYIITHNLYE